MTALQTRFRLDAYRSPSPYLDFDHPLLREQVAAFVRDASDEVALAVRTIWPYAPTRPEASSASRRSTSASRSAR